MKVQIDGMSMWTLGIPQRSIRGPYQVNNDSAYVDHRCVRRYRRRRLKLMGRNRRQIGTNGHE